MHDIETTNFLAVSQKNFPSLMTRKGNNNRKGPQFLTKSGKESISSQSRDIFLKDWNLNLSDTVVAKTVSKMDARDLHVIAVDVSRSVAHWDIHRHISISKRVATRRKLKELIICLGSRVDNFRYYQGLHEVSLVALEVCDGDTTVAVHLLERIVHDKFMHLVMMDFNMCLFPMLEVIQYLVYKNNPELANVIDESGGHYHFAIPWILTWFAHSLELFDEIFFMFDFLIHSTRPNDNTMIIYVCAAIILLDSDRIMNQSSDSCHVLKCTQSSVRFVSLTNARKLAVQLKQTQTSDDISTHVPQIKFLLSPAQSAQYVSRAIRSVSYVAIIAVSMWAVATQFINDRSII